MSCSTPAAPLAAASRRGIPFRDSSALLLVPEAGLRHRRSSRQTAHMFTPRHGLDSRDRWPPHASYVLANAGSGRAHGIVVATTTPPAVTPTGCKRSRFRLMSYGSKPPRRRTSMRILLWYQWRCPYRNDGCRWSSWQCPRGAGSPFDETCSPRFPTFAGMREQRNSPLLPLLSLARRGTRTRRECRFAIMGASGRASHRCSVAASRLTPAQRLATTAAMVQAVTRYVHAADLCAGELQPFDDRVQDA